MWKVTPVLMKLHNEMSIANENISFYVLVSYENLLRKLHGLAFVWCYVYEIRSISEEECNFITSSSSIFFLQHMQQCFKARGIV